MTPACLSDDLLHTIFFGLDQASLASCGSVCRQWRSVSLREELWMFLKFVGDYATAERIEGACLKHSRVAEMHLVRIPDVVSALRRALPHLKHLKMLKILHQGNLPWSPLSITLQDYQHSVEDLIVCDIDVELLALDMESNQQHVSFVNSYESTSHNSREPIRFRCDSLRQVAIVGFPKVPELSFSCPLLERLSLELVGMRVLHLDCPNLQFLQLSCCPYVAHVTDYARISELHISDCPAICNYNLLSTSFPNLKRMSLSRCKVELGSFTNCMTLESLSISQCGGLTETSPGFNFPNLRSFTMEDCHEVKVISLDCDELTDVRISHCPLLQRLHISSPALTKLDLDNVASLTTLAIDGSSLQYMDLFNCHSLPSLALASNSPFGYLRLANCTAMRSLTLNLPRLKEFCIYGCGNLVDIELGLLQLPALELGGCHSASNVRLLAPNMTSLSLAGCRRISNAEIWCPELLWLSAFGCRNLQGNFLENVIGACPRIQTLHLNHCSSLQSPHLWMLRNLPYLTELDVSYTNMGEALPTILRICPQLKILRLAGCRSIQYSTLDAEAVPNQLEELDVSYGTIGGSALQWLLSHFTQLSQLNINGCENLRILDGDNLRRRRIMASSGADDESHHPSAQPFTLRVLNCAGCPNMKTVTLTDTDGFSNLESVNLVYCGHLVKLRLECSKLTSLNLRDCTSLAEHCCIRCPRLTDFCL